MSTVFQPLRAVLVAECKQTLQISLVVEVGVENGIRDAP